MVDFSRCLRRIAAGALGIARGKEAESGRAGDGVMIALVQRGPAPDIAA